MDGAYLNSGTCNLCAGNSAGGTYTCQFCNTGKATSCNTCFTGNYIVNLFQRLHNCRKYLLSLFNYQWMFNMLSKGKRISLLDLLKWLLFG